MKRLLLPALLALAAPLSAQSAGKTGAQVLQFNAGARAAALSGAYSAVSGDADALFYNPAGIAAARYGASAAYETYSQDVAFGSVAGFARVGAATLGAGIAYLDAGQIEEILPDPDFGGNTGIPTGNLVSANETAARLAVALPLREGQLRIGAAVGLVSIGIAEISETAPIADVGVQCDVAAITVSAAARNLGGSLAGDPLPTELRLGVLVPVTMASGFGINAFGDAVARTSESSFGFAGGVEAGVMPRSAGGIGLVARISYDADANQLAGVRFGAGISLQAVAVDYAYQNLDFLGAVHRFGVRWAVR